MASRLTMLKSVVLLGSCEIPSSVVVHLNPFCTRDIPLGIVYSQCTTAPGSLGSQVASRDMITIMGCGWPISPARQIEVVRRERLVAESLG